MSEDSSRHIAFRLAQRYISRLQTLSWLHQGNQTDALREAIDRYYAQEGERAEAIQTVVEGAEAKAETA